jgi:hypothetical protein
METWLVPGIKFLLPDLVYLCCCCLQEDEYTEYASEILFCICLQEWRHAHGMRCLGIPNTAHFANVTQIEDALACECYNFSFIIVRLVRNSGKVFWFVICF